MKTSSLPDPRCIFAIAACLSLYAVFTQTLRLMLVLLVLAVISASLLGAGLQRTYYQLKRLWQVVIIVALLQSLFSPSGDVWVQTGRVILLSSGGLEKGFVVLGRLAILIISGALFTLYETRELIQGMIRMKLPYEVAYMISAGVRFIPMMGEELRDSLIALALRGVVIDELPFRSRIKVYTYLLLPMVAGCLHNAGELAMSMEMRGFGAYPRRTSYFELIMTRRDYTLLAVTALLAAAFGVVTFMA